MPIRKIKPGRFNTTSTFRNTKTDMEVQAESTLEADFLFSVDQDPMVEWYDAQPLKIAYRVAGESRDRTYIPDVLVRYKTESRKRPTLFEVKFRTDLAKSWLELKPKFKAAVSICKANGWKFKIVTEKEIRTPALRNTEFLFHFSRTSSPVEAPMRSAIFKVLSSVDYSTPEEVLSTLFNTQLKRAEALPVLWRMIYDQSIEVNMDLRLNMQSEIRLRRT